MMRVLQLTTYPLKSPRHGGQLRCAAIRECYRAIGIEVETVAVMREDFYRPSERERHDIVLPAGSPHWDSACMRLADLQTGLCLAGEEPAYAAFAAFIDDFRPDLIQLEQPWLYPAVKRWLGERQFAEGRRPRLVYSSQNVEWKLKRDELAGEGQAPAEVARRVAEVKALEQEVAAAADLLVACTAEELEEMRGWPATNARRRQVVAHNAIAPYATDPAHLRAWQKRIGLKCWPLFVGSAHPPNASGFWDMLAPSLAFLRPEERIVVAGGVGHLLRQHRTFHAWSGINEPRLAIAGEVSREDLSALLLGASVIVLPITTGGGSNLKTAEAIYSGRPVLATPHALRGYGDPARWPTISVAGSADAFRRRLRELLDHPPAPPSAEGMARREEVTWAHALAGLAEIVGTLPGAAPVPGGTGKDAVRAAR